MKKSVLLGILLLNLLFTSAQHLEIEKERSQLYITHKVTAKETLYSLGRMYNLSPKDIAAANKLKTDAGLQIGQEVRIPLKKENFIQANTKSKKGLAPVYHTIQKGENLGKLSKNYNHVKEELLKKWNRIPKGVVKSGQELIVGYVKFNAAAAAIAKVPGNKAKQALPSENVAARQEAVDITVPLQEPIKTEVPKVAQAPEQPKTGSPKTAPVSVAEITPAVTTIGNEGFFAADYSIRATTAREKKLGGTAATFKSTSGWSDKKYYLLVNNIAPETIVKLTANGKSVYAKVLESLPDLKDNKGIVCRLSNAAASALGITDVKFDVEISFYE
jgi:LysM repeat protein